MKISLAAYFDEDVLLRTELSLTPTTELQVFGAPPTDMEERLRLWWLAYWNHSPLPYLNLRFDWRGLTPFTRQVLAALQKIPVGEAMSYGDLASLLGRPQASRAVGSACGRNPFPLLVPCHRILKKPNFLGGFSCGLEFKRLLLEHEEIAYLP
ncbi:MAG: MGMT family protein [Chlamydiia bacterium]|nr:MGMT family protein [Chlamydiia bacterium]